MRFSLVGIIFSLATPVVFAEEIDLANGQALYEQKCQICHGAGGASLISTQPILSAQLAQYNIQQLQWFRDGIRNDLIMSPMVAGLSDQEITDISHYLENQEPVIVGTSDLEKAKKGEELYRVGDANRSIPACTACHGAVGEGLPPSFPRLSGQYPVYTTSSLEDYASEKRYSDIMSGIAAKLSEEDIENLSAYISGLSE